MLAETRTCAHEGVDTYVVRVEARVTKGLPQLVIVGLPDAAVREAFDVTRAPDDVQDRYGRNAFGWSLLMARRLVERGVRFVGLDDALSDPVYSVDTGIVRQRSYTLLNQLRVMKGLKNPPRVQELYDLLPEDRLSSICK